MAIRNAHAEWNGDLKNGEGTMKLGSGAYEGSYSFKSRFEDGTGTNPEELIGAALAGCFSMALSNELAQAGFNPKTVETNADVDFGTVDGEPTIKTITLNVEGTIEGIDEDEFKDYAEGAKDNCPVSRALAGVDVKLNASLT